jgi:hypothetical protein
MGNLNINIGSPRDQSSQHVTFNVVQQDAAEPAAGADALRTLKQKLAFFQKQEAVASGPAQRFELMQLIEEAKAKIQELGASGSD